MAKKIYPEYPKPFYLPPGLAFDPTHKGVVEQIKKLGPKGKQAGEPLIYADNEKEEDLISELGYTEKAPYLEYPKHLHHPTENKFVEVNSQEEEAAALAGKLDDRIKWLADPADHHYEWAPHKPAEIAQIPASVSEELADLKLMLLEQQKLINSLLLDKVGKKGKAQD